MSSKSKRINVGIIGRGWVAEARHIPAFRNDKRVTIEALMDRDYSKAELTAKKLNIPRYFGDLEDFLQEPLDVVSICTPPMTHSMLIRAALEAGKHVLVEKPMTMTAGEGAELDKLAADKGLILCPAHNFLYSRAMQEAKKVLLSGGAGEVCWAMGVQLSSWQRRLPTWFNELPGGLFFDEAPHLLYLMRYFLGDLKVEHAWHSSGGEGLPQNMERIEARMQGANGNGYLTMWFGAPFSEWLLTVFCSNAVLVLDLFRDIFIQLPAEKSHRPKDVLKSSLSGAFKFLKETGVSGIKYLSGKLLFGHNILVGRFIDAVVDGAEPPATARDGWEVVSLIEDILQHSSYEE